MMLLFDAVNSELFLKHIFFSCFSLLPACTPDGHRVIFCQLLHTDPSEYIFADALKLFTMLVDVIVENEPLAPGFRIIFDMAGLTLGHVNRLSIGLIEKILFYLQVSFSCFYMQL